MARGRRSCFLVALVCSGLLAAPTQESGPLCFVIPDEGRVSIIIGSPPVEMAGFLVYRRNRGEEQFNLLVPEPVVPVEDPLAARDLLGEEEYALIARAVGVEPDEEFAFLRRLKDPGVGGALSLVSTNVARVLGKVFVDTTARTGNAYTYRVAFTGHEGEEVSRFDETVVVRKHEGPGQRVTEVSLSVGKELLRLGWRYPKWQGDRADIVVGFNVYRRSGDEQEFTRLTLLPYLRTGEELTFVDEDVAQGQTCQYYLRPVDLVGAEGPVSDTVAAELRDITAPPAPVRVAAKPAEGRVVLSWQPPPDEDIAGYNIYRSWSIHGQFVRLNPEPVPRETTQYIDGDVRTGELYVYRVSALDRAGLEGKRSTAVFASPEDATPPPPVSGLSAEVVDRMVGLSWSPGMTADLDGYYVYRGERRDNLFRLVGSRVDWNVPVFIDSGLARKGLRPGRTYCYAVSQVDIALNEGERSVIEVTIPDDEPPDAVPSVYCRSDEDGAVEVSWQASLSSDVAAYRVYRREAGTEPLLLDELGPTTTRLVDRTCARGRRCRYAVAGVDSSGNEGAPAEFEIVPRDAFPPPVPTGLRAEASGGRVVLTWDRPDAQDLAGYHVYRSDQPSGIYERIDEIPPIAERFSDPGGGGRYYRVSAFDTSGNEGERTAPVSPASGGG